MRIKVSQEELSSVLSIALRSISARSILPVLSGVKLAAENNSLRVSATDLEITLHCVAEVKVEEVGKAILPAKLLNEVVKNLPAGSVELLMDHEAGQATISCERARYSINGLPLEDYPQLPESALSNPIEIEGEVLSEAIRQVIKAVGRDEARPTLGGVLFSISDRTMKIVATDSYRLAVKEIMLGGPANEISVIVPARAVEELGKLTGADRITMSAGENQIFFKAGEIELISRLIEGQFPPYERLLPPDWETRVTFNKEAMISAIKRVSVINPNNPIVRCVVDGSGIKLNAFAQDVGSAEDEVECSLEGNGIEIAFNAQYFTDGLAAAQGSEVFLEMTSPLKPALLKSQEKTDYLYLIMPIRLS